ncbi:hypothetical protein [Myxococcus sp. CA039A]|uniref:hypothetical protein n=1 Tax=Myxococcus sp. CA039A TaxID=2741737 RepID=UPI00157AAB2F|nr:hypothetical protein [Myxococcus sp. CA039A]NTX57263.1 hypothetical protein [Myxococcus sp. CA039A]
MAIPRELPTKVRKPVEQPKPKPKAPKVTAAQAKKKAEKARTEAKRTLQKAHASEKKATEARKTRGDAGSRLDKADKERAVALSPGAKDTAQKKVETASKDLDKADKASKTANEIAAKDKREALAAANKALAAEKEANDAAEKEKLPKPYALADRQKDVFDAGSLSAKDQEKLFGTKSVVSSKEAATSDARRVADASSKSPRAGAEELKRQLALGQDPAYRKALVSESAPQVQKAADAVGDKKTPAEDRNAMVKSLADSAALAGPEGRKPIVDKLNAQKDQATVIEGLKSQGKDANTLALGATMARELRASAQFDKADAITQASPELKKAAAESPLDTALRKEVDLQTVAEEKAGLQKGMSQTQKDLKARTQALEKLAQQPEKLPPGVSIESRDGYGTTLVTKDDKGQVTERTRFGDRDDMTYVTSQKFDRAKGTVEAETLEDHHKMGTLTNTRAAWTDKDVDAASKVSSLRDVEKRRSADPKASFESRELSVDGDKRLVEKTVTEDAKNGTTQTTRTFGTQDDEKGLNDQLKGKFDDDRPLDKVDTKTVHIPPEGAKDPDGKPAKASYTFGTSYSQDNARVTASESKVLDRPEKKPGESSYDSGFYDAAGDVEYRAEKENGSPKSWTLQTSNPGELNTQTFIEGKEDLSVTTRKKLDGNTVTETTEGRVPDPKNPDGDPVSVKGDTKRTFDGKGRLASAHSDQTEADGTRTVRDYALTEKRDDKGRLQTTESSTTSTQPKDGPAVEARSELTRTFDDKDRVVASHLDQTDETGARAVQDYSREEKRNAQGEVEIHERTTSSLKPKDGPKSTQEQEQVSVDTKTGPELIRASNKITNADGTAQHSITPEGQTLTVNGEKVDSVDALKALPKGQASLGGAAVDGLSQQVRDFNELALAMSPNRALNPDKVERNDLKEVKAAVSANSVGMLRLKEALTPALNGQPSLSLDPKARLVGGASGIAGLAGSAEILAKAGPLFMRDFSQGNYLGAAKDGVALVTGTIGVVSGGSAVTTALRGAGSGLTLDGGVITAGQRLTPMQAAKSLNGLAKLTAGLGVLSGGMQAYDGIQKGNGWAVASGVTTATAAVGGYLAAGAAAGAWGGPAGAAVGLAIGLGAWGMTKAFDHFDKSDVKIAQPTI